MLLPPGTYCINGEATLVNPTVVHVLGREFVTGLVSSEFGNPAHKKDLGGLRRYVPFQIIVSIQRVDGKPRD
ncbi:hypothetical protein K227x_39620 [Rubripirellula lacrimiformis]|uniref:Uncharacterized protein n=2 Tax=Rubripirellula lacrimiformis TaxID=1930273 RepID=A0A517NEK5_9BACT|nr:hypothetical protein K227x_39620 [Rubripirellula lacrimiformis]